MLIGSKRHVRVVMMCLLPFAFCLTLAALPVRAALAAEQALPEGPGKEETVRICGQCHSPERGTAVRLTRGGWEDVIAKMVSLGARGTDAELAVVLDYLATNFKGEALRPINVNTATAIDLESVAGLLRKESAAVIAHRTKHGPCDTLDDLKKIPGVDFRKIQRRRDRLVCLPPLTR
jgi:competence protein ComEA